MSESNWYRMRPGLGTVAAVFAIGGAVVAMWLLVIHRLGLPVNLAAYREARGVFITAAQREVHWYVLSYPLGAWLRLVLLTPFFFAATGSILLAEWAFPAHNHQPVWSASLVNDFVWFLASLGFVLAVVVAFEATLQAFYYERAGFLTVGWLNRLPTYARFGIAILFADFVKWFNHWIRHKVKPFWYFHSVHHAQPMMNVWTTERVHIVDHLVEVLVAAVPMAALRVPAVGVGAYALCTDWHRRFYHANIRTNFGILKYLLVTPQSHRVHHSVLPEHQDKNFGVLFSIWDHLFGTQWRDYEVYPESGVDDPAFPHERGWYRVLTMRSVVSQVIYPFRLLLGAATASRPMTHISTSH